MVMMLGTAIIWGFFSPSVAYLFGFPDWFLRLDLLLAWGAFGISLVLFLRRPDRTLATLILALALFALAQLTTAAQLGIPFVGAALSYSLLALPLAVIATLMLLEPAGTAISRFLILLLGLAALLIPISLIQIPFASHPDDVVGTFPALGLGSHLNGALTGAAALWILGRAGTPMETLWAAPFVLVTVISDSKQVLLLLPVVLAFSPAIDLRMWAVRLLIPAIGFGLAVWAPSVPGVLPEKNGYVVMQVENTTRDGGSRKVAGAEEISQRLSRSPENLLLGLGQAKSVSYPALLADREGSQTVGKSLGLEPPLIPVVLGPWDRLGSFYSEFSSAIGLIGDLGLLGLITFSVGLIVVGSMIFRTSGPERGSVWALGLFYLGMGFVYIWWEQPVFSLFVSLLVGLTVLGARQGSAAPGRATLFSLEGRRRVG